MTDPDGTLIYDNYLYSDPVIQRYDPPLAFDSPTAADRTVRYCATYNNGLRPDGEPDVNLVTRASRVPPVAQQYIGKCTPVACVVRARSPSRAVRTHDCDSTPGAGDAGAMRARSPAASTENEMSSLFGAMYIDPDVPGADFSWSRSQ